VWPDYKELLIFYEDDYSRNNTWIWDGKPHWAYARPEFLKFVQESEKIYWTPNTIESKVFIDSDIAEIELISATPNLKEYQMKVLPSGNWTPIENKVNLTLKGKENSLIFRTVNFAKVTGPEHKIVIKRR
jgi:hypothetical protein